MAWIGGGLIGLAAVGALVDDEEDEAQPSTTTDAPAPSEPAPTVGAVTLAATDPPTTTEAPVATEPPAEPVKEVNRSLEAEHALYTLGMLVWSDEIIELFDDVARGAEHFDVDAVTSGSIELWRAFRSADRPPSDFPGRAAIVDMLDTCEDAYDRVSDAWIALDIDEVERSLDLTTMCNTKIAGASEALEAALDG